MYSAVPATVQVMGAPASAHNVQGEGKAGGRHGDHVTD